MLNKIKEMVDWEELINGALLMTVITAIGYLLLIPFIWILKKLGLSDK